VTALCGGGTSAPKPTTPTVVTVTLALLYAWVASRGVNLAFISNILSFLGLPDIDTATFCASDPPAIPTFDLNDALAIASLPVGSPQMATTAAKVADLMMHIAWYELCECTSGTPTPEPAPAAPPTGAGTPLPLPAAGTCGSYASGPLFKPAGATNTLNWLGLTQLPLGTTTITLSVVSTPFGTTHCVAKNNIFFYDMYGVSLNVNPVAVTCPSGSSSVFSFDRDPRAQLFAMMASWNSGCEDQIDAQVDFYCGTATPSGTTVACCPPDDVSLGMLQAILNMVTLQQRQTSPFAYVPGATHSGLTGNGEISVQGLLGAKISASVPGRAGIDFGNPDTVFEIGWINWGTADGFLQRERLTTSPQLSFPPQAGSYTKIGYSIPPDVTVSILELIREP
jgi:hypothetical protein